ncbi:hypothetical protein SeMB42_g05222 [Synchytrium endobioticum]|uniref:Uncharacterized protein n=1 Tax=Synchytrium endobioticum TaxID=286115 RepID=A0A507CSU4_9FUNG|nr:hypothetical protein SeMB42_g05222 [Synchytrium endobioticum]
MHVFDGKIPCSVLNCRVFSESRESFEIHYQTTHPYVMIDTSDADVWLKAQAVPDQDEEEEDEKDIDDDPEDIIMSGQQLIPLLGHISITFAVAVGSATICEIDLAFFSEQVYEELEPYFSQEACKLTFQRTLVKTICFPAGTAAIVSHPGWPWRIFAQSKIPCPFPNMRAHVQWNVVIVRRDVMEYHESTEDEPIIQTQAIELSTDYRYLQEHLSIVKGIRQAKNADSIGNASELENHIRKQNEEIEEKCLDEANELDSLELDETQGQKLLGFLNNLSSSKTEEQPSAPPISHHSRRKSARLDYKSGLSVGTTAGYSSLEWMGMVVRKLAQSCWDTCSRITCVLLGNSSYTRVEANAPPSRCTEHGSAS